LNEKLPENQRPRARDIGLKPGVLHPGKINSITDVDGVRVGHETLIIGQDIRTGVTAVLPHGENLFREKVPATILVQNGYGKLAGSSQVNELGEIETPILLTNTLCVPRVADALIDYMFSNPENADVLSINPVVGETNDGYLNDIRKRQVGREDVFRAIQNATIGSIEEGCVGAGTGPRVLGFKGGIGTSSRVLSKDQGGYTVGVLVQTNFGGLLNICGAPVGKTLKRRNEGQTGGSVMVVIATDAPVCYRNLRRMARRGPLGLGRSGFISENQSGDYFICFSTAKESRIEYSQTKPRRPDEIRNDAMDPLFQGVIEATEEAVYNSLFRATTTKGRNDRVVQALPIEETKEVLRHFELI
jgi:D-aminopeptidase